MRLPLSAVAALLALLAALSRAAGARPTARGITALHYGDARYRAYARCCALACCSTILPSSDGEELLAVGDDLAARRAIRLFRHRHRALERSIGRSSVRARGLPPSSRSRSRTRRRRAVDSPGERSARGPRVRRLRRGGGRDADQAGRSCLRVRTRSASTRRDEAAKFNLELALRLFQAQGVRPGRPTAGRAGPGRRGAGSRAAGVGLLRRSRLPRASSRPSAGLARSPRSSSSAAFAAVRGGCVASATALAWTRHPGRDRPCLAALAASAPARRARRDAACLAYARGERRVRGDAQVYIAARHVALDARLGGTGAAHELDRAKPSGDRHPARPAGCRGRSRDVDRSCAPESPAQPERAQLRRDRSRAIGIEQPPPAASCVKLRRSRHSPGSRQRDVRPFGQASCSWS